jgi:hypothetical protein
MRDKDVTLIDCDTNPTLLHEALTEFILGISCHPRKAEGTNEAKEFLNASKASRSILALPGKGVTEFMLFLSVSKLVRSWSWEQMAGWSPTKSLSFSRRVAREVEHSCGGIDELSWLKLRSRICRESIKPRFGAIEPTRPWFTMTREVTLCPRHETWLHRSKHGRMDAADQDPIPDTPIETKFDLKAKRLIPCMVSLLVPNTKHWPGGKLAVLGEAPAGQELQASWELEIQLLADGLTKKLHWKGLFPKLDMAAQRDSTSEGIVPLK